MHFHPLGSTHLLVTRIGLGLPTLRFLTDSGRENVFPSRTRNRNQDEPNIWIGQRASWGETLMGALPFLLFGLAYFINAIYEQVVLPNLTVYHVSYTPMAVYFITAIGLVIGWLKGFPRWSYSYLGMALYFGWYYSNGRFYGVDYGWRAWIPVIVAGLVALLLTRSLRPLTWLVQGIWNDWTRLSFALYAFLLPMFTIIFFDMKWGIFELSGLFFDTILLAAGAIAFLRSRAIWQRVVSLQAAMFLLFIKGVLFANWYSSPDAGDRSLNLPIVIMMLLFWGGLMFLPGLVGLLRRSVSSLSTR